MSKPSLRASAGVSATALAPVSTRKRTLAPFTWPWAQYSPSADLRMVAAGPAGAGSEIAMCRAVSARAAWDAGVRADRVLTASAQVTAERPLTTATKIYFERLDTLPGTLAQPFWGC